MIHADIEICVQAKEYDKAREPLDQQPEETQRDFLQKRISGGVD